MTCAQVREWIDWYPGDRLGPRQRGEVVWHVADCPACRAELVSALAAAERVRAVAAAAPGPPAAVRQAVLAGVMGEEAPRGRRHGVRVRPALYPFLPPVALLALAPLALLDA